MKPLILITNDDGIFSPGLKAAARAVSHLGDLLIVAPQFQQTSMSRSFPRFADSGAIVAVELELDGIPHTGYGVCGSPAMAVCHAVLELAPRKPSLCISGINYGENIGLSITESGTVGAALEANSHDIPALAVSLEASIQMQYASEYGQLDWSTAVSFTRLFAEKVLKEGLPPEIAVLNINVPASATLATPVRVTRQSRQNYFVFAKPAHRDFTQRYELESLVELDRDRLEPGSDIHAFAIDRVVSVTPLAWDLTANTRWGEALSF